jgi:hypothetical protein
MQSTIPPTYPLAVHLTRVVLHPYGRQKSPSYTLSLYDTGVPHGEGKGRWFGYRLYEHIKGQKSTVIFWGADEKGGANTGDVMLRLIDRLTTRPGDTVGEGERALTPEQLNFLITHASALRAEAQRRFGWAEKLVHLRSDLEAVYHSRALKGHGPRHRFVLGVLQSSGATKSEARRNLELALGAHASALPRIVVGEVTGFVYVQYAHGADTVVQIVDVDVPHAPLKDSARFSAASQAEADDIADTWIAQTEREHRGRSVPEHQVSIAPRPALRPSARASIRPRA